MPEQTTRWRPIEELPHSDTVGILLNIRMVWEDMKGNPVSFGPVRDFAERLEIAFFKDGEWWEAGTGHSVFNDWRHDEYLPTHWMPAPEMPL